MDNSSPKEHSDQQFVKRKKKRSLIQQVNKRFKSASFPKGKRFDGIQHEYFLRVFQLERIFEGTVEEKSIFANNSLVQTEGQEVECSFNQLISRVIENLLPLASNEVLERFFDAFGVNLRPICVHDYASHVLQALMIVAARHSVDEAALAECPHVAKCRAWLYKVSRYLLNNIEEFMWDKYANPTLRTAMFCLAAMPQFDKHDKVEKDFQKLNFETTFSSAINVPEEFIRLLEEYFRRIKTWPQFNSLVDNPLSSGYLQALLRALRCTNTKKYKSLCNKILADCFPSSTDENSSTMFSPTALPVLEVMVEQSKGELQKKIYEQLIQGRVLKLSTARVGNITLQKFINKCNKSETVDEIMSVLAPEFGQILACKNDGVLTSLGQACERLKTSQSEFFKALTLALNCDSPEKGQEQVILAILSLTPLPHDTPPNHKRFGSLLLQSLLKFQKPIKLVNSLLLYEPTQLAEMLSSPYGCHITGAFCKSESIGEKSRLKLIKKLMGHYPYLAQSKFGSRSFDDIWDAAELQSKEQILRDLASAYSQVMSSQFGKFVAIKVRLEDFRNQGVDKWRQNLQRAQSKKKLFATIIGEVN